MPEKLRVGILGHGMHAKRVLPAFQETSLCEVVDVTKHREDYGRLLGNPAVQLVYVCLPNHLHASWTISALKAGKHVLCEKPLCSSTPEASLVIETARREGRQVFEGFMYRFHPQHRLVQELLQEEAIGSLQSFEARYEYFLDDTSNIRLQAEMGGGALLDAGCYTIDCTNFFFKNPPKSVQGTWEFDQKLQVDRRVSLTFAYDSNIQARLSAANNSRRANSYALNGTQGSIHVTSAFHVPRAKKAVIEIRRNGLPAEILSVPPANHFALQFEAVAKALNSDHHDRQTEIDLFSDFQANARLLELSALACQSGETISCGPL